MLKKEFDVLEKIRDVLSNKVFIKVNATSQEAAEAVVECIKLIDTIEGIHKTTINKKSKKSKDFADEHEDFITDTIKQFDDRNLHSFVFVSDGDCINNIVAGNMPERGLISNLIQVFLNMSDVMVPVLNGIGFPTECVRKCEDMHRAFKELGGKLTPPDWDDRSEKIKD
jgi:hypothetical protein